jgi:hypothetical protein
MFHQVYRRKSDPMRLDHHSLINVVADRRVEQPTAGAIYKRIAAPDR